MAQKQIFRNGNRLGFLPWGSGRRLGAARWTDIGEDSLRVTGNQIQIANTAGHRIPEIPNLFRNEITYDLPERTLGAHFTLPQPILWHIDGMDSDSYLDEFKLFPIGAEGSSFSLSAEVESVIIDTYECQIEEKENVQLDPFTVNVRPLVGHEEVGMCQLICNTREGFTQYYEADLQKVELRIGQGRYAAESQRLNTENRIMHFGSLFTLHLSKCLREGGGSAEVKWFTGHQVFTAEVTLNYTELHLDSILPIGHFDPKRIHLAELYTDGKSEDITTLDLLLGETTLHGWPVSLKITTPTAYSLIEVDAFFNSFPIKREKIQEWFDSPSEDENYRSVTLTPYIAGQALLNLTSTAHIYLDIPERPFLGFQGEKNVDWKEFLLRSQGDYHTIQNQHDIDDLFADKDWIEEMPPEKRLSMNRNNIYRMICVPMNVLPVTNCAKTSELLEQSFKYCEMEIEVIYRPGKLLGELYESRNVYEGKKVIDVGSSEVQILYPREKFILKGDGNMLKFSIDNAKSYSQENNPLAILTSHGNRYTTSDSDFDYARLQEAFAYRVSNDTLAAPQLPGVYYLYAPSKGDHYFVEIEVHGFIEEVTE